MNITTARLILRPWREADAAALFRCACEPDVAIPAGWPPHADVGSSREILRTILMKPHIFALTTKSGTPIGNIHLDFASPLCTRDGECELGFWLGKPYWGQGLMTEAAQAMLVHAFANLGAPAVWSGYFDGNERSRRVQEKLGFSHIRTDFSQERTVHRTRLSRDDWRDFTK